MSVAVSKRLSLVIPIEVDEKTTFHVHSQPILSETFKHYHSVLAKAFNQIHSGGYGIAGGSRVAEFILQDVAERDGTWEGPAGVKNGLLTEIVQRTNVMMPGETGWQLTPLYDVEKSDLIDADDVQAVRHALVFFTLLSWMLLKRDLPAVMVLVLLNWGGQLTPLNATEFRNSLQTSTETGSTAEKPPA